MAQHALYTQFFANPGKGKALVEVLVKANYIIADAEGCNLYIINTAKDDEDTVWVTELWDKEENHAISLTLDGCKELVTEASFLLAAPPRQIVMTALAGKGLD